LTKRLKGKIVSVYLDQITEARLQALAEEMSLSRSAVLRMLVGEKWKERADQFLSAVQRFDEAKTRQEAALMQAGVGLDVLTLAHRGK
jgi:predicted transcriptional regulator